jgi:putative FmdB family regulatory protein
MPTYEYLCTACQHGWEAEQSMKDEALKDCPSCKGATAKRQISLGAGFVRGGGAAAHAGPSPSPEKAFHQRFEQVSGIKTGGDK